MTNTHWIQAGNVRNGLDALRKAESEGLDSLAPPDIKEAYRCAQRILFTQDDTRTRLEKFLEDETAFIQGLRHLETAYAIRCPGTCLDVRSSMNGILLPRTVEGFWHDDRRIGLWTSRYVTAWTLYFDTEAILDLARQGFRSLSVPHWAEAQGNQFLQQFDCDFNDFHPWVTNPNSRLRSEFSYLLNNIQEKLAGAANLRSEVPPRWEMDRHTKPVRTKPELRKLLDSTLQDAELGRFRDEDFYLEKVRRELRNTRRALRCFGVQMEVNDSPESLLAAERELERIIDLLTPESCDGQLGIGLQPTPEPNPRRTDQPEKTGEDQSKARDMAGIAILEEWHFQGDNSADGVTISLRKMGKLIKKKKPKQTEGKSPKSVGQTFFDRIFKQEGSKRSGHSRYRESTEQGGSMLKSYLQTAVGDVAGAHTGLKEAVGQALADSRTMPRNRDGGSDLS